MEPFSHDSHRIVCRSSNIPVEKVPDIGTVEEIYTIPKKVRWIIPAFFLLPKKLDYAVTSPEFYFFKYNCRLEAFPNGTSHLPNLMILKLSGIGKACKVHWELEILRTDDTVLRMNGGCKEDGWEEEMNLYIPYQEVVSECYCPTALRVTCTLYAEPQDGIREVECSQTEVSRLDKLSNDLEVLLSTGDNSNVTIKVGNAEFSAHISILGARAPVFTSTYKDKLLENVTSTVEINDCDADTFQEFLRFLYSGMANFSPYNVFSLYKMADKYQVSDLKECCIEYIKGNLSADIFCDVVFLSVQEDEEELLETATEYFLNNMRKVKNTEKWQNFVSENPRESEKLLQNALKLKERVDIFKSSIS